MRLAAAVTELRLTAGLRDAAAAAKTPMQRLSYALLALVLATIGVTRAESVSLLRTDGTRIAAHWFAVPNASGPRPAVVALHGCGGLYRSRSNGTGPSFDARYPDYVQRLHRAGAHVLLPDSFGSRGAASICTVKRGARTITVETRRGDAIAAVQWLAARADVDARRIALLGWSNGATTALATIDAARAEHAPPLAGAIVFYPGCGALLAAPARIDTPLLMLLGERDDWTPPGPCIQLAERTHAARPEADITVKVYADSYHGFDSERPVRFRADVPNGASRAGVHQGGNPAARAQSRQDMDEFLARILK